MGINDWSLTVTGSDVPEDVNGVYLTGNGLQFLGLPAMFGRNFAASDAAGRNSVWRVFGAGH